MSDSVRPHTRQPTRLPRPWDSPGKNTGVGCHFLLQCMKVKSESEVAQSCLTPSDPMDCSPPGSSVHGIFQARVLEWGAIQPTGKTSSKEQSNLGGLHGGPGEEFKWPVWRNQSAPLHCSLNVRKRRKMLQCGSEGAWPIWLPLIDHLDAMWQYL